jgi:hypothetical protein
MDRADVAVIVRIGKACVIACVLSSDIFLVNVKGDQSCAINRSHCENCAASQKFELSHASVRH